MPRHDFPDRPRRHEDPLSGRAVIVAPRRADRPQEGTLADCPFCAGNEHLTPHELLRSPADPGIPWEARIIPNKYPFAEDLPPDGASSGQGGAAAVPGFAAHGVHDVIIESARHETSILGVDPSSWRASWGLAQRRLAALASRRDLAWGLIFKNSGPGAGASLEHVHSQLVALDFLPPMVAAELAATADRDPFTALLCDAEKERRVIATAGDLVALVPPAPRQPLETWIVPRQPGRWFHAAGEKVVADLADLTREVAARIDRSAPGADYNWWLHQAPFAHWPGGGDGPEGWRWHLEIVPRITALAGFELGTGCHVSVVAPEESARRLRRD